MELSDYRRQIDDIDSQLLALFYRRMDVAAQIGGYKKAHNLPALDAGRERAKLQQIADSAPELPNLITSRAPRKRSLLLQVWLLSVVPV